MSPLVFVYEEEEEILLWRDFVEMEMTTNILPPKFVRIQTGDEEQRKM
jgi:hypothetical protein